MSGARIVLSSVVLVLALGCTKAGDSDAATGGSSASPSPLACSVAEEAKDALKCPAGKQCVVSPCVVAPCTDGTCQ